MRFSKLNLVLSLSATCFFATSAAFAQDEPAGEAPAGEPAAPAAPAAGAAAAAPAEAPAAAGETGEAKGVHEHDGFFFRIALGAGYMIGKAKPESGDSSDLKGLAIPGDLSFGGTVAPGVVIGGGSFGAVIPAPKYSANGNDVDGGMITMSAIGPFVDYYLNPKTGLNFEAALLFTYAQVAEKDNTVGGLTVKSPKGSGAGFGFLVGGGYDLWIGEQWSLSLMARIAYYNAKVTYDLPNDPKATLSGFVPGVLIGVTYH